MFATKLIDVGVIDSNRLVPRYLTERDRPWVETLADCVDSAIGLRRHEVEARLSALRLDHVSERARRAMISVILASHGFDVDARHDPIALRRQLFDRAAASCRVPRDAIIDQSAAELGLSRAALEAQLYADLPAERRLRPPKQPATIDERLQQYNLKLAQSLLFRAETLTVRLTSQVRPVLRFARLQRLLVSLGPSGDGTAETALQISGPLSLFRFTTKYGNAMARWLPALTRVPGWSLRARCRWEERTLTYEASHRDPIGTTHKPTRRFDSKLEARFFRDLLRSGTEWQVLREATPQRVGSRLLCPDFTLVLPSHGIVVPVEIVGYWTPEYLDDKLRTLNALPPDAPWLICLDSDLAVASDQRIPASSKLFVFRKQIDIDRFLLFLEAHQAAFHRPGSPAP